MIRKDDCIILLTEIQEEKGIDVTKHITELMNNPGISVDVIKFINTHRPLDIFNFYEKLRKSYNNKKSKLYLNLVKEEFDKPTDVLTTLASLALQILLYNEKLSSSLFLKHSRFEEITRVLNNYSKTYDLVPCLKVLYLIKSDIKMFDDFK